MSIYDISTLGPLRKEIPFPNNSSNNTVKTLKFI